MNHESSILGYLHLWNPPFFKQNASPRFTEPPNQNMSRPRRSPQPMTPAVVLHVPRVQAATNRKVRSSLSILVSSIWIKPLQKPKNGTYCWSPRFLENGSKQIWPTPTSAHPMSSERSQRIRSAFRDSPLSLRWPWAELVPAALIGNGWDSTTRTELLGE